ncbi:unnamed protein product [Lepidochelys kempii]
MRMQVLSFCHSTTARCFLPDLIIFFITCSLHRLESARFKVVGPDQPVIATVGEEIVLPCHLSPKMSAENMEVTWFRSQLSPFVHRYSDGKDQYGQQMSEYQRRTELFKDGLTDGNVALRIFNIRPSDEGQYSCFVQEGMDYEEAQLEQKVSAAFFPKANPWMVALSVILMIFACFIGITIYLFKIKGKLTAELGWRKLAAPLEKEYDLDPDTVHPHLLLSVDCKSVKRLFTRLDCLDNPKRFEYERCVLGYEGFNSGRHYWEVEVGHGGYWAVGIARESVRRKGEIIFSTEEGIWAVGHWGNQYLAVTSPRSPLALKQVPKRIRVSLDNEVGKVAFFDADKGVLIFTFPPASFAGEKIHPWLWVWDLQSQLRLCP